MNSRITHILIKYVQYTQICILSIYLLPLLSPYDLIKSYKYLPSFNHYVNSNIEINRRVVLKYIYYCAAPYYEYHNRLIWIEYSGYLYPFEGIQDLHQNFGSWYDRTIDKTFDRTFDSYSSNLPILIRLFRVSIFNSIDNLIRVLILVFISTMVISLIKYVDYKYFYSEDIPYQYLLMFTSFQEFLRSQPKIRSSINFIFSANPSIKIDYSSSESQLKVLLEFLKVNYSVSNEYISLDIDKILKDITFNQKGYVPVIDLDNPKKDGGKLWRNVWRILNLPQWNSLSINERIVIITWVPQVLYLIILFVVSIDTESFSTLKENKNNKVTSSDELLDIQNTLLVDHKKLTRLLKIELRDLLKPTSYRKIYRTYTGYDTEYETMEFGVNDLISVQLSSTNTIGYKILKGNNTFDFSLVLTGVGDNYLTKANNTMGNFISIINTLSEVLNLLRIENIKRDILIQFLDFLVSVNKLVKDTDQKGNPSYYLPININSDKSSIEDIFSDSTVNEVYKTFKKGGSYSIKELIQDIKSSNEKALNEFVVFFNGIVIELLENIKGCSLPIELLENINFDLFSNDGTHPNISVYEMYQRILKSTIFQPKLRMKSEIWLLSHFSIADISMLNDYQDFKREFDILRGSLTTCQKPTRINNSTVYLRDTANLSDVRTSLEKLGESYGVSKLNIKTVCNYNPYLSIRRFSREFPSIFKEYGIRDAYIALIHGLTLQNFNLELLGNFVIPTTIPSIARRITLKSWNKAGLTNFQQIGDYHIGDFKRCFSSKGIQRLGDIASAIPYFLGLYRGGRNESFAYGKDESFKWFDFDLTGAYATAISGLGVPDISNVIQLDNRFNLRDFWKINSDFKLIPEELLRDPQLIESKDFIEYKEKDFNMDLLWKHSYAAFKVNFAFPVEVNKPCIPVTLDKINTIYPSTGKNVLVTQYELKVALDNNCIVEILDGYIVPFKKDYKSKCILPYFNVLQEWAIQRKLYPKGSAYNLIYKLLGNALYGQVSTGLNIKRRFDSRLGIVVDNSHGLISNPIVAQAISGIVRAALSETLIFVDNKGGKVVSCTTDGFLTDIEGLDDPDILNGSIAILFKGYRDNLVSKCEIYELAYQGKGLISWTTRGQLGLGDSKLSAITGFQSKNYSRDELQNLMKYLFNNHITEYLYFQKSLRKATEIWKDGGSVTLKMQEIVFRLCYDNRRQILDNGLDASNCLVYSEPFNGVGDCKLVRHIMNINRYEYKGLFNHIPDNSKLRVKAYGDITQFCISMFLRGYLNGKLTLPSVPLVGSSELRGILSRVNDNVQLISDMEVKVTRKSAANIRGFKRYEYIINQVQPTPLNLAIINYFSEELKGLDMKSFFVC